MYRRCIILVKKTSEGEKSCGNSGLDARSKQFVRLGSCLRLGFNWIMSGTCIEVGHA
jgi:hypothetical protein